MNNINIIIGPPGTGKTTYLMNLLEDLLKQYNPDEIAFCSFTKKGSYEGRDRALQKFTEYNKNDFPYFKTLHALAFADQGISKYDIISRRHYKDFSKSMNMNFLGYYTEDLINNDDKFLFANSLRKNNGDIYKNYTEQMDQIKLNFVAKNYERFKQELGILDFDDLLTNYIKENRALAVKVALIDEAQDLTGLQWEFCKVAFKNCEEVFIAGDDDQAIFEYSGADVQQFLHLANNNSLNILNRSYRLKSKILDYSEKIIQKINNRVSKKFEADKGDGTISFYNSLKEIIINSEETYYFLSRNNYFLPSVKRFIMGKGVPFSYKGEPYIKPTLAQAIVDYEHSRKSNPTDIDKNLSIKKYLKQDIIGYPVWYDAFEMDQDDKIYYRDLFKNKVDINDNKINIGTIHSVKGGEADNVVLILDITKNIYLNMNKNFDSELRCLYVALTRAKKNLHIVFSSTKFGYDEILNIKE